MLSFLTFSLSFNPYPSPQNESYNSLECSLSEHGDQSRVGVRWEMVSVDQIHEIASPNLIHPYIYQILQG